MSIKRIEFSSIGFLLYAEIVRYCLEMQKKNNPPESIEEVLLELAKRIVLSPDRDEYLDSLMDRIRYYRPELDSLYGKITTQIRADKKDRILINEESDIASYFEKIKAVYPQEDNIRTFIKNRIEPQFEVPVPVTSELNEEKSNLINDLLGTTWYLYYHEYDLSPDTHHTIITRLILKINSETDIQIFEKLEIHDFRGEIDVKRSIGQSIIIINLDSAHPKSSTKKLQIRIIIEEGISSNSIFLGQYIDFESSNIIVSGTIVIENVLGHRLSESIESKDIEKYTPHSRYFKKRSIIMNMEEIYDVVRVKLVYNSGWEQYIPREIAEYLTAKGKNHNKTKSLSPNSSLEKLGTWIKEQRKKKGKFNAIIDYDCFLVTPIGNIKAIGDQDYFKEINEHLFKTPWPVYNRESGKPFPDEVYQSADILKEIKLFKIFYTPRVRRIFDPSFSGEGDSQSIISDDIEKMKRSRFVVLILPKPEETHIHHTSAFIKIGWAMEQEKPIIIFPLAPGLLPRLLMQSHIRNIHISEPVCIKEIPEKLKNDYGHLLEP